MTAIFFDIMVLLLAASVLGYYAIAFSLPFSTKLHLTNKTRKSYIAKLATRKITFIEKTLLYLDPWVSLVSFILSDIWALFYLFILLQWVKTTDSYKRSPTTISAPELIFIISTITIYFLTFYSLAIGYKLGIYIHNLNMNEAFPRPKTPTITTTCCAPPPEQDIPLQITRPPTPPVEVRLAEELALYRQAAKGFQWPSSLGLRIKSPQFCKLPLEVQYDTLVYYRFDQKAKRGLANGSRWGDVRAR